MGFAFLESYWYREDRKFSACKKCKGKRGSVFVQYSLNVNNPQLLKDRICPRCDRRWCEKTYPPILWGKNDNRPVINPKKARSRK